MTFSRSDLAQFLIDEAGKRYPDQIHFHFNQEVDSVDLAGKQVWEAGGPDVQFHPTPAYASPNVF